MLCPKCDVEMRIKSSEYVLNNGELFNKMTLTCRNKKCTNYDKEVKIVYAPLAVSNDNNAQASE